MNYTIDGNHFPTVRYAHVYDDAYPVAIRTSDNHVIGVDNNGEVIGLTIIGTAPPTPSLLESDLDVNNRQQQGALRNKQTELENLYITQSMNVNWSFGRTRGAIDQKVVTIRRNRNNRRRMKILFVEDIVTVLRGWKTQYEELAATTRNSVGEVLGFTGMTVYDHENFTRDAIPAASINTIAPVIFSRNSVFRNHVWWFRFSKQ